MTDTAPERIWALADRRKHWQEEKPRDGENILAIGRNTFESLPCLRKR